VKKPRKEGEGSRAREAGEGGEQLRGSQAKEAGKQREAIWRQKKTCKQKRQRRASKQRM
jgi:hypothetical protein